MFVHSVYFSLRADLGDADRAHFETSLQALAGIETVRHAFVGPPAETKRAVIDRGYSHGLILVFDDQAGHDVYQDHPVHDAFRDECSSLWQAVRIFDVVA